MAKASQDLSAVIQIDARHLKTVPLDASNAMTSQPTGNQPAKPDASAEQSTEPPKVEPELTIQSTGWIRNSRQIRKSILLEEMCVTLRTLPKVNKHDTTARCFDLRSLLRQV